MTNIKFVSVKSVIAYIYSKINAQMELRHGDIIEWIGEALNIIGCKLLYEENFVILTTENHRGILPCNLVQIKQVTNKQATALVYAPQTIAPHLPQYAKGNPAMRGYSRAAYNTRGYNTFTIQYPYIITDKESEELHIFYLGYKTDEEGFPFIPDIPEMYDALLSYVAKNSKYAEMFSGRISPDEYSYFDEMWVKYKCQTQCRLVMPDQSEMATLSRMNNRIVGYVRSFEEMYKDLSYRQNTI